MDQEKLDQYNLEILLKVSKYSSVPSEELLSTTKISAVG